MEIFLRKAESEILHLINQICKKNIDMCKYFGRKIVLSDALKRLMLRGIGGYGLPVTGYGKINIFFVFVLRTAGTSFVCWCVGAQQKNILFMFMADAHATLELLAAFAARI